MSELKPFHQWKEEHKKTEPNIIRPKEYYYKKYGEYCQKIRKGDSHDTITR